MKKILKSIFEFIKNTFGFLTFILKLILKGSIKNNLKNKNNGTVAVLANGPSLKLELPKFTTDKEFEDIDFIVLNFFAFEKIFFEIKPKHYCFADPMFFQDSNRKADVIKIFNILENQVDWDLRIYIPSSLYLNFVGFSKFKNSHLIIVKNNELIYSGFESYRYFFYKKGLAMPRVQTVANLAIFIALNSGYLNVRLYGVDHTFFDNLKIDSDNKLCSAETHFYDNNRELILKPLLRNDNDEIWKISDYLEALTHMFKSHDELSAYAKYLKVNVLNYTACSMIDSYDRFVNKLL